LVLGDAAGYIEPFTGEGIGWAAASAAAVVPFAEQAVRQWQSSISRQWSESLRRAAKRRQWFCRAITWITRHPRISRLVVSLLSWMPWLGRPLVAQMRAGTLK
jgi:flavin-dependent dehydrogenase